MSGIKGFPSQEKLVGKLGSYDWQQVQTQMEFVTAQKSQSKKIGLDTIGNGVFRTTATPKSVASLPSALDEQKRVLISTAHGALPGDMIRFEATSANPHFEAAVLSCPDADTMILGSTLPNTPVVADNFYVLRYITSRFSDDGSQITSQGPLQYVLDNVVASVTEDTATPANNKPLPVKLMGTTGPINITAGDLNVQLSDQGANPDVTRIGDGTKQLGITASNEAKVSDAAQATAMATLNAKDFATSAKQDAQTALLTTLAAEDFSTAALQTANNTLIGAVTETAPASDTASSGLNGRLQRVAQRLTSLIALLPTSLGQKTMANGLAVTIASDQTAVPASQSGTWNITNVSGTVSLPTGAATAANQSSELTLIGAVTETAPASDTASSGLNGRLQRIAQRLTSLIALVPASLGSKTGAASFSVVLASDQVLPLPTGAATETTLAAASAKLPATIGQKAMAASLAVTMASDQSSIPVLSKGSTKVGLVRNDYTSVNVTTSAYTQLVASTSAVTNMLEIFDSSGETLVFATGGAGSEVDQFYISPGGNGQIPFTIPAATRISIKAVTSNATVGYINLNLYS